MEDLEYKEQFDKLKTKVLKYILYKKRTENEIRAKFQNEIEENMFEDIIEYLKHAKYIDDNEYIKKVVSDFIILKNLSIKEIEYKLLSKGLSKDVIADYVYSNKEELEEYEIKSIQNILYKKSNLMQQDDIINYLRKKGYKYDNIKKAVDEEN